MKFLSYDDQTGGPFTPIVAEKLLFIKSWYQGALQSEFPVPEDSYKYLIVICGFIEILGALLHVLNLTAGAALLGAYLTVVTPIMHNYWDVDGKEGMVQTAHFWKNVALLGSLLAYLN